MKKRGVSAVLMFLSVGLVHSQWLETTIYVPDSLCGILNPHAFTYNATNNKIYVGGEYGDNVIVIDGATNEKTARIPAGAVGAGISSLCWNSTNNKVYCANSGSDNVTVIDAISNSVIKTIPVGSYPHALVYNPTNNKVYCANIGSGTVAVIDGDSNSVLTTIPVSNDPKALAYNPTNNKVYCANSGSNDLTVIDGDSNGVVTTIPVGVYPRAFAWNPVQNRTYVANYLSSSISVIRDVTGINESPIAGSVLPELFISPNPFKAMTEIKWQTVKGRGQLKIYDATGKAVRQWGCQMLKSSDHIIWSGSDDSGKKLPAGVYFCRLETAGFNETKKTIKLE